mgnify:CR=1 FL=1
MENSHSSGPPTSDVSQASLPQANASPEKKPSLLRVIVHSFFVVPFLIAVFAVLIYLIVRIITMEQHTTYDYLNDIKTGAATKRWQAAFELSRILANSELVPKEERFVAEMIAAFEHAEQDDNRVRQYLALAMGRTGNIAFVEPLIAALGKDPDENKPSLIHALGTIRDPRAVPPLMTASAHPDGRIRLNAIIALGNIGDSSSIEVLRGALNDAEPNIRWDAAIALAKMKDPSGKDQLLKLLDRNYYSEFPEVSSEEVNEAIKVVIEVSKGLQDTDLQAATARLAKEDPNMKVRHAAMEASGR